jgi:hypothetical protein
MTLANSATITIDGTDGNGNTGVLVTLKDATGKPLEYVHVTSETAENVFAKQTLQGTENTSGSITVYRSGKTCIIKGIDLDSVHLGAKDYDNGRNGFLSMVDLPTTGDYANIFTPGYNVFWYNEIILTDSTYSKAIPLSFLINGTTFYNRLERSGYYNQTWNDINFSLTYLIK